ncbi:flippase [Candidatus Symbiobacter mobilis]|uniref:flippase n=1 Tax=Candidatus Symbiobacter mobilis TaxID=1436290 RepID=UPI001651570A|nr:flippase [Candidatus Symbiobacter mobilis]
MLSKLLPAGIYRRISLDADFARIAGNMAWMFADKVFRLGLGALIGVWIARYLGPQQFGLFNYGWALVFMLTPLASLGLGNIVIRELVKKPEQAEEILGSALVMQATSGLVAYAACVLLGYVLRPDDMLARTVVAILGMTLLINASDVIRNWYASQVQTRYVVWTENAVIIIFAAGKVVLILTKAPLLAFAWIATIESVLVACGLFMMYQSQNGHIRWWIVRIERAKSLIRESWMLIFAGFADLIHMRIDQVMLGNMLGDESVGIYSAALRISGIWYAVPYIIVGSLAPAIIKSKMKDEASYQRRMQHLFDLLVTIALPSSVLVALTSDMLIESLFGLPYKGASAILQIHIWSTLFLYVGVAGHQFYLADNLQRLILSRTVMSCIVNIALNYWLIPIYGGVGAACATLVSYSLLFYGFDAMTPHTIGYFRAKTKALLSGPIRFIRLSRLSV